MELPFELVLEDDLSSSDDDYERNIQSIAVGDASTQSSDSIQY
jgi:hypothetical protein